YCSRTRFAWLAARSRACRSRGSSSSRVSAVSDAFTRAPPEVTAQAVVIHTAGLSEDQKKVTTEYTEHTEKRQRNKRVKQGRNGERQSGNPASSAFAGLDPALLLLPFLYSLVSLLSFFRVFGVFRGGALLITRGRSDGNFQARLSRFGSPGTAVCPNEAESYTLPSSPGRG